MNQSAVNETTSVSGYALNHLLRHLQRSGITVLPRATSESVTAAEAFLPAETPAIASSNAQAGVSVEASRPIAAKIESARAASTIQAPTPSVSAPVIMPSSTPAAKASATPSGTLWAAEGEVWQTHTKALAERTLAMRDLAAQVAACTRCEQLACRRKNTVFGEGNFKPRVCFFGEAPGMDEDRMGRPFVGASGQLLDRIIAACTMRREDVYILNTIKCRPPDNRNPLEEELANCREYFIAQLENLQPEYIVCLGLVAARALLPSAPSIGRLRGRFHQFRGAKVLVTYHPSYLLRTPSAKAAAWDDMKLLMREMGIELPKK